MIADDIKKLNFKEALEQARLKHNKVSVSPKTLVATYIFNDGSFLNANLRTRAMTTHVLNIKDIREHMHLSQQQMADAMGVSENTYRPWEYGTRQINAAALRLVFVLNDMYNDGRLPEYLTRWGVR